MFKTKEIKTNTLGEKLKKARESIKMTLRQASEKTKIPSNYLKCLEEENYKELPTDVYVAAYLRKYAEALGLDVKKILERHEMERGMTANLLKSSNTEKDSLPFIKKTPLVITPKRLSLVFAVIIIALIFGYFWHQLSYLIYSPNIKISQPVSDFTTQEKSVEVFGQTNPDTYLTINGREVHLDNKGYFKSIVGLEFGLNILKIEARDRFGKTNSVTRRVMVTR